MSLEMENRGVTIDIAATFNSNDVKEDLDVRDIKMPEGYTIKSVNMLGFHSGLLFSIAYKGDLKDLDYNLVETRLRGQLCR